MAYETYPKRSGQGKDGSIGGWSDGHGVSYPGKKLASSRDDTETVHVTLNRGNSASAPGKTYPKGRCGKDQFPALAGLPS